jgi:preprotein translocase SecY subunit
VQPGDLLRGNLPKKLASVAGLLVLARSGVYVPLPGVDVDSFQQTIQKGGLLGYVDQLAGGSISNVGVFSLGIVPYINSSIVLQVLSSSIPYLKSLQKDEGEAGRRKFQQYQRYLALAFALVQAFGQCAYIRPFVTDFSFGWLVESTCALTAGAMALMYIGESLNELRLGNGTSLLIFANIVSSLPQSATAALEQAKQQGSYTGLAVYGVAFVGITLGIVYVQEAERKLPISRGSSLEASSGLGRASYLPFKVNSTGVLPIIFSSSILGVPAAAGRFTGSKALQSVANLVGPGGQAYLPTQIFLIAFFNYFYTFLQLDPDDVAEQLKKQGASISGIRPGKSTSQYISATLGRLSVLGGVFLALLAGTPAIIERVTQLQALRGFAGTSVLILVGVATDTVRRIKSEALESRYTSQVSSDLAVSSTTTPTTKASQASSSSSSSSSSSRGSE